MATSPRDVAFSKILYVVPLNNEANAAVNQSVLAGSTNITANTAASAGVSANSRHFIPLNAPAVNGSGGIDYGSAANNQTQQRNQCERLIGQRDINDDDSLEEISFTVYGET